MAKITLTDVTNFSNDTSSVAKVNSNNTALKQAFENTLSRDGTSPNQMGAELDMNSHRIINVPAPFFATDLVRLQELSTITGGGTVTNLPSGGAAGFILAKHSGTNYDVSWQAPSSLGGAAGGDLSGNFPNPTLAGVITAGGPTGSSTVIPVITYDAKGRLTAVTTATIAPTLGSLSGLGTGVATALAINVGTAGATVILNGALGTPASGVATNLTGIAAGLTAGSVTTNANLTGVITSSGNATVIASQTGTGTKFVVDTAPTIAGLTVTGSLAATGLVTNANLVNSAAATLKGNPTAGSTAPSDFTIQGLTARGSPDATNDKIIIYDNSSGTLKYVTPGAIAASATSGVATFAGTTGAITVNASFQMVSQDLRPSSTFSLPGTLSVTGTTTLGNTTNSGTLGVTGAATFTVATHQSFVAAVGGGSWYGGATTGADRFFLGSDATLVDNFRLYSTLAATNALSYQSNSTVANSAWVFNGGVTLANSLTVSGNSSFSTTLAVTGATTLSSTLAVTGISTLNNKLIQTGGYAYIGGLNASGVYPSITAPSVFATANNFTGTGGEVDFWNIFTSAVSSFNFYQQTGASAGTLLMTLSPTGILTLPSRVVINGSGLQLDVQSTNSVGSAFANVATQAKFISGSAANPLLTATPSVAISRYEALNNLDTEGGQNAALWVESVGNNISVAGSSIAEVLALGVSAIQLGSGDVVALYGQAQMQGSNVVGRASAAYGLFTNASAQVAGSAAYGYENIVINSTGIDYGYFDFISGVLGSKTVIGIALEAAGNNLCTAALWVRSGGQNQVFDVGLGFNSNSIKTAAIRDDSSSITSYLVVGSHTNGIDTSFGAFSGSQLKGTGYSINPTGLITGTGFKSTASVSSAVAYDASSSTLGPIANGSSASIALPYGLLVIHEVTALGEVSLWLTAGAAAILVSQTGTSWVASTTTPAAGKMSVAYNGALMAVYNNRGGASSFFAYQLQV